MVDASASPGAMGRALSLEIGDSFPSEVDASAVVALKVRARCACGCDLGGVSVRLESAGQFVAGGELGAPGGDGYSEVTLSLQAPSAVGDWTCHVVVPASVVEGTPHAEGRLEVKIRVLPHATSLAVWDVPSTVRGGAFHVSVGAKCRATCTLSAHRVEILDEAGVCVGSGVLADAPYAGTSALYATEVTLSAPPVAGVFTRTVRLLASEVGVPHLEASASFTFRSLDPPECVLSVRVVPTVLEPRGAAGIEVWVGPHRGETNGEGIARVGVPKGTFELRAWRVDLEPAGRTIDVTSDTAVQLVMEPRRLVDEDAEHWG